MGQEEATGNPAASTRRAFFRRDNSAFRQAGVLGLPLAEDIPHDRTRSDLECDFLWICRRYRLPMPEINVMVGGYEADFVWRELRFVVETDGYRHHRGKQAFA